ncbi:MAG: MOSC domain-containing protein [Opitutaceae bacterium]
MRIRHIFISPGHNYFGHHGKPAGRHRIDEVREVECVAGEGLRGDRFFGYKEDYKGQITLFAWEVFQQLCLDRGLDTADISPAGLRRNIIVEGADLGALIGKRFVLQGVEFEGTEECRPCYWMDQAVGPGVEAWMRGRGGLRCRILTSGVLRA